MINAMTAVNGEKKWALGILPNRVRYKICGGVHNNNEKTSRRATVY